MIIAQDALGNKVYVEKNSVYLYLSDKKQVRQIWIFRNDKIYVKRSEKHLFRKFNAYGFNLALIRNLAEGTEIIVKLDGGGQLRTNAKTILEHGKTVSYLNYWFETQIFLPLDKFLPY